MSQMPDTSGDLATSSRVSTETGNRSQYNVLVSWYLTKSPRPAQPGHPSVGR